jgi:hypothetical protein
LEYIIDKIVECDMGYGEQIIKATLNVRRRSMLYPIRTDWIEKTASTSGGRFWYYSDKSRMSYMRGLELTRRLQHDMRFRDE